MTPVLLQKVNRRLLLLAVLQALLLASSMAWAQGSGPPLVQVSYISGSADSVTGLEVMKRAYERIGQPVEFIDLSAAEALESSNSGKVDAELQRINGIIEQWPNLVQVPIPINLIQGAVFSRAYRFPITGWHSLRPFKIGIVKGIVFSEQQTRGFDRTVYDDYQQLVQALRSNEVQVGVMPRVQGLLTIQQMGEDSIQELEGVLETLFLYHYVHNSQGKLGAALEDELKSMLLSGEIREIRQQKTTEMLGAPL